MTTFIQYKPYTNVACDICKHRTDGKTCKAFPSGIPYIHISINVPHWETESQQQGDYVFELCELKEDASEKLKEFYKAYKKILGMRENRTQKKRKREPIGTRKCVEVIKYIINKLKDNNCTLDIYHVVKMLYFADRIHLLKYQDSITITKYLKLPYGPIPKLCLNIIRFVRGDRFVVQFDESIKEEFEVLGNRVKNLNNIDTSYLSNTDIKCIDAVITSYGHLDFNGLKKESQDEIYKLVSREFTIYKMLMILENNQEFANKCLQIFDNKVAPAVVCEYK
jgi:hypothetical protein